MFRHGQLFMLKNRSVNVWSEQSLYAGPALSAHQTGDCLSLVRGLGATSLCVPGMAGVCAHQDPPVISQVSPVFCMVPSGILAWMSARLRITIWDAAFEPKRPALNPEL